MPLLLAILSLPLLAISYQYTDDTGTIQVVETKEEVPPRFRRSMKMISEDSHSAVGVASEAKPSDDVDVRDVIDDALAKQKPGSTDKIITFEALAKKKGETAPSVKELKERARAEAPAKNPAARGVKKAEPDTPAPTWAGYIPLLAGLALAFIGIAKLRGFMRLASIGLGLVLTLFGFVRAFPESPAAKQVSAKVDEVVEKTGTKEALESAQETVSKPFLAPLEMVGKTKDAIRQAEEAQKAKIKALDELTGDD
ncbi:MAG: hypothetical protein CMH55_01585 [Myxococcales bacterium]|nr:hypothetical protein [Myxococcales bacterium]